MLLLCLQPGQEVPLDSVIPTSQMQSGGTRRYAVNVTGHQLMAFESLLENVDLSHKQLWIFYELYTSSARFYPSSITLCIELLKLQPFWPYMHYFTKNDALN